MRKEAVRKQRQAVRLLHLAVARFKVAVESSNSYKPSADTSVAMFERYVKRLEGLIDDPGATQQFWSLHQRVYIRLLKRTLRLRD